MGFFGPDEGCGGREPASNPSAWTTSVTAAGPNLPTDHAQGVDRPGVRLTQRRCSTRAQNPSAQQPRRSCQ